MKILILSFVAIALLLSGCDETKLLAKLESADRIRVIDGQQERIIRDREAILGICRSMTAPERKWRAPTSFASLPVSAQRAVFEKDGKPIAYLAFGSDWLLISFYASDSTTISCPLTELDFRMISRSLGL